MIYGRRTTLDDMYSSLLIPLREDTRHCLGKKFASNIRKVDAWKINNFRRKIEDIKLAILDAAEQGLRPPRIPDVNWLYDLYNDTQFKFLWDELVQWFSLNGLEGRIQGSSYERYLQICVTPSINIGKAEDPTTTDFNWRSALNNGRNFNR